MSLGAHAWVSAEMIERHGRKLEPLQLLLNTSEFLTYEGCLSVGHLGTIFLPTGLELTGYTDIHRPEACTIICTYFRFTNLTRDRVVFARPHDPI